MSIRPLPDEVVAQIKSSIAIVSLTGVVLELLKNSLDAKASKVDVTIDFVRGGCVVEDDGLGIPPAEFSEDGGLGKLYCTSKFQSKEPHLGQHGTFLASLAALSLLTITSHHHAYRSHNSISFHHSQVIERQIPTNLQNHVHGKHGTRVTVRNLFGNMPVRVKQRSLVTDQKAEHHRVRDAMKKHTAGLLLSWQGPISLKIRDGDNRTIVNFNTTNAAPAGDSRNAACEKPRSAHLSSLLHIMTQANYIAIGDWASWVPVSASTAALSIKGAISLEPSPTKHVQFISFGLQPLSGEGGHNELYDQVNRLFALSSFGTVEDDNDIDEQEKIRRQSDRRFKNDGYTNRQLRARKGVDKYPMFHLRISLKDRRISDLVGDLFIEDETNLQAVVDIFSAMITQWLSVHHFRPRKQHQILDRPKTVSTPLSNSNQQDCTPSRKLEARMSTSTTPLISTSTPRSVATNNDKKKSAMAPLENALEKPRQRAFAEWSRIKSGKSSFFDGTISMPKASGKSHHEKSASQALEDTDGQPPHIESRQEHATFSIAPISKGALGESPNMTAAQPENSFPTIDGTDESVLWTDPSTKKTYLLNARTGCVIPSRRSQSQTDPAAPMLWATQANTSKSLRVTSKPDIAEPVRTPWLDGLLQTWDNPVFKPSERDIQRVSHHDALENVEQQRKISHMNCTHFDMQKTFNDAGSGLARLSKEALFSAKVISQVDKKFILVKMDSSSIGSEAHSAAEKLVLIDQHAADERIRVESLLTDLCNPVNNDALSSYRSKLGLSSSVAFVILEKPLQFTISPHEHTHFKIHAASFASWGILYDISSSVPPGSIPGTIGKDVFKLSVTTLPPAISERCKADLQLLISFLRSAIWKYVETPTLASSAPNDQHITWVQKTASCPPGLIDMINSRACRSAVMFNDELSLDECKGLVKKLADCVFPFMCAHGRPSMVPIVDLAKVGYVSGSSEGSSGNGSSREESFIEVWKRWKR